MRETAELLDFPFIDRDYPRIKEDDARVAREHRAEIELEILFSEGKNALPVVDPSR